MKVRFENGRFKLEASIQEIYDTCGEVTGEDYRNAYLHLASVAAQNDDAVGLDLIANMIGAPTESPLPPEVCASMQKVVNEAVAVGKEITLRKLSKVLDPHGEFIDVPVDWIGKGEGA